MLLALRALLVLQVVVLAHIVLSLLMQATGSSGEGWANISEGIGLVESAGTVAALGWLFRERRNAAGAERLQAALVLAALDLLLSLVLTWRFHFSEGGGASPWLEAVLPICVGSAATLFLWLALTPIADEARTPTLGLTAGFAVLLVMRSVLWLARAWPGTSLSSGFEETRRYLQIMSYASEVLGTALNALLLVLLLGLVRHVAAGDLVPAADAPERVMAHSRTRDILIGAIWIGVGVTVTAVSFAAASGGGGGRYFVAYGAVVVGLARIVRGLTRRS